MLSMKCLLASLATATLFATGPAQAACVNYAKPWGYLHPISGSTFWANSIDQDVPWYYFNSTVFVKGLGYTAVVVRPRGAEPFTLSPGLWQGFADDFDSCRNRLPGSYRFIQVEVK